MRVFVIVVLLALCSPAVGQEVVDLSTGPSGSYLNAPATVQEVRGDRFHLALTKAIRSSVRKGDLKRSQALRVRVALLSPAFRKHVQDLAVIQMAFSTDADVLPFTDDGRVDRAAIDWDNFLAFLEKLIPLILQLIELFGA